VRPRRLKSGYFVLEAINSYASVFFLFYLFFLTSEKFGFTMRGNLLLMAVHGFCYALGSWQGGRLAQRCGYFTALKLGYGGMMLGLAVGLLGSGLVAVVLSLILWTLPLCCTWPALEALATEGENRRGIARMTGAYSVVWSTGSAVALFSGGWLWDQFGATGLYGINLALLFGQLLLTLWLERQARAAGTPRPPAAAASAPVVGPPAHPTLSQRRFLLMAWWANPFSYVAINTVGAVIPQIAEKFHLSPTQSGVFCSLWFFTRAAAFAGLWYWPGWHYRFRWLLAAYLGLSIGFAALMLSPLLWLVVLAQILFGCSIGLVYYSSLFYSMDAGEAKGEHGGLHEAAIGLGIGVGPAVGAAALTLTTQAANAGTWAVSGLLTAGLAGLLWWRRNSTGRG